MPAAVVKDGTVAPKFRQGKISPPFLTAKFSPRNSPLAKFPPPPVCDTWLVGGRRMMLSISSADMLAICICIYSLMICWNLACWPNCHRSVIFFTYMAPAFSFLPEIDLFVSTNCQTLCGPSSSLPTSLQPVHYDIHPCTNRLLVGCMPCPGCRMHCLCQSWSAFITASLSPRPLFDEKSVGSDCCSLYSTQQSWKVATSMEQAASVFQDDSGKVICASECLQCYGNFTTIDDVVPECVECNKCLARKKQHHFLAQSFVGMATATLSGAGILWGLWGKHGLGWVSSRRHAVGGEQRLGYLAARCTPLAGLSGMDKVWVRWALSGVGGCGVHTMGSSAECFCRQFGTRGDCRRVVLLRDHVPQHRTSFTLCV